jgi:hypothetical protein
MIDVHVILTGQREALDWMLDNGIVVSVINGLVVLKIFIRILGQIARNLIVFVQIILSL